MKTLTRNTTQPSSEIMREIANGYRPIPVLVKLHNYIYYHGYKSLIWAVLAILFAITFVTVACPDLGKNIIHDILAKR